MGHSWKGKNIPFYQNYYGVEDFIVDFQKHICVFMCVYVCFWASAEACFVLPVKLE